ncbi:MAG: type IV pilus assembly protein PilM [Planctomyces sp.]|nr:type IV pilus assembly protein PilM [Planctomyces sp.]
MAEAKSAWGIDIGQAGLKAIRLRSTEDGRKVVATAFDYVPHPKILSQPDAIPDELIKQAITTFLERNKIGRDPIAISVPGQTSLAKFIKLPPVESSKISEIVKYEARQQIPFDLADVIWDYQPIGGGVEEGGFMLEAEVGLFAMKRDLVYEAMKPFTSNKKEVEIVQLAPLALYNYLSYDVLAFRKSAEVPEPPASEDYYVLLDMGADNTTLLVSNGRSIWIRNVPIGGNHFTRALTREMKLTFAKAEHLKCNATKSPDPKAVFQAMRPVFNDYVTEIQRSIGFFGSVNRSAKIKKLIGIGNGFRLAGLQKFLQQNLQYDVERLESLHGVSGDPVLTDPIFMDNIMTFAVPYGLALQAIGQTRIRTTLLPPEIAMERKIRTKKPWAVAAAAGMMLTMGVSTMVSANVLSSVSKAKWEKGEGAVSQLTSAISSNDSAYKSEESTHQKAIDDIAQLVAPLEKRVLWMEMLKAVNECLPRDEGNELDQTDLSLQKKIRIDSIAAKKVADVGEWHKAIVDGGLGEDFQGDDAANAPTGEGYIVTLRGFHLYNNDKVPYEEKGRLFTEATLGANLRKWIMDRNGVQTPVGQIGISHPLVVYSMERPYQHNPNAPAGQQMTFGGGGIGGAPGMGAGAGAGMAMGSGMDPRAGGGAGGIGGAPGMGAGGAGMPGGAPGMGSGMDPRAGGGGGIGGAPGMAGGGGLLGGAPGMGAGGGGLLGGAPGMGGAAGGAAAGQQGVMFEEEQLKEIQNYTMTEFVLQFVWKPTKERDRLESPPATAPVDGATESSAATP